MTKKLEPKDFSKIVFISSPSIHPREDKVLFVRTRADLDKDKYFSQLWIAELDGEVYPVTRGEKAVCGKWSPDGKTIAFLSDERPGKKENEKGNGLWLVKPGGEPWFIAWFENGVNRYSWFSDSRRILVSSAKGKIHEDVKVIDEIPVWFNGVGYVYGLKPRLYIVYTDNGEVEELQLPIDDKASVIFGEPSPDGKKILYVLRRDNLKPLDNEIHVYDLDTGEDISLLRKPMRVIEAKWSPDGGKIVFRGHHRERGTATHYKVWIVSSREENQDPVLLDNIDRNHGNGMNCDSRGPMCQDDLWWDTSGYIYYPLAVGGEVWLVRTRPGNEPEVIIRGGVVDEFSVSNNRVAYTFMTFDHPNEVYMYIDGRQVKLTGFNDRLVKEWGLRRPEKVVFRASDGVEVEGWVLKPYNSNGGKHPVILEIHGGPKTAYGEGFMYEFHMLASNGFYVVFSNPRGSDGYTQDFADIREHWGERDYMDLMEFMDTILARYSGEVDENRLGVIGGSYGGFMTNWIVTHTKRFKAAVTQRSISLWFTSFGATDIGYYFDVDQIGGYPWQIPGKYWEKSPLRYVENVETPLLIIHSTEDYRCHLVEAIQLFTALKTLGKEAKLVIFPGENHDLSRRGKPKHRAERLKHILEWFKKYLQEQEDKSKTT
ncbi:S9 family peptidase [Desulfurococcaceae archaeon MEX13E-LK6-19]|nr:S9 family peptidase [Desulfurococcaceae archaeon MEX13E-LK6-19]